MLLQSTTAAENPLTLDTVVALFHEDLTRRGIATEVLTDLLLDQTWISTLAQTYQDPARGCSGDYRIPLGSAGFPTCSLRDGHRNSLVDSALVGTVPSKSAFDRGEDLTQGSEEVDAIDERFVTQFVDGSEDGPPFEGQTHHRDPRGARSLGDLADFVLDASSERLVNLGPELRGFSSGGDEPCDETSAQDEIGIGEDRDVLEYGEATDRPLEELIGYGDEEAFH